MTGLLLSATNSLSWLLEIFKCAELTLVINQVRRLYRMCLISITVVCEFCGSDFPIIERMRFAVANLLKYKCENSFISV